MDGYTLVFISYKWHIPALKVANTASIAVEDAVPAPVRDAKPPIPAARAGAKEA